MESVLQIFFNYFSDFSQCRGNEQYNAQNDYITKQLLHAVTENNIEKLINDSGITVSLANFTKTSGDFVSFFDTKLDGLDTLARGGPLRVVNTVNGFNIEVSLKLGQISTTILTAGKCYGHLFGAEVKCSFASLSIHIIIKE